MTWRLRWPPWRRADDHADEALLQLAVLDQRAREVEELGRRLRAQREANHFSAMVAAAIARGARNTTEGA